MSLRRYQSIFETFYSPATLKKRGTGFFSFHCARKENFPLIISLSTVAEKRNCLRHSWDRLVLSPKKDTVVLEAYLLEWDRDEYDRVCVCVWNFDKVHFIYGSKMCYRAVKGKRLCTGLPDAQPLWDKCPARDDGVCVYEGLGKKKAQGKRFFPPITHVL